MAERLIDAEALRKEMQEYVLPITTNNLMGAADAYYRILHLLEDAPTIEAKPVVHAHWVTDFDFDPEEEEEEPNFYFCSKCKEDIFGIKEYVKYCPFCGAQMDELVSKADELNSLEKPNNSKEPIPQTHENANRKAGGFNLRLFCS